MSDFDDDLDDDGLDYEAAEDADFDRLLAARPPDKFRMDGSPYPSSVAGLLEWSRDVEDARGRRIGQDTLWNGLWVSTVWLGLNHRFGDDGPPLIFETMVFNHFPGLGASRGQDLEMDRYATLPEAEFGHRLMVREVGSLGYTLRLWWGLILGAWEGEDMGDGCEPARSMMNQVRQTLKTMPKGDA